MKPYCVVMFNNQKLFIDILYVPRLQKKIYHLRGPIVYGRQVSIFEREGLPINTKARCMIPYL